MICRTGRQKGMGNRMSLVGTGAVAIWHDIAPEGREDFYAWHGTEHMPERVGISGFQRGRRYCAIDADLEFFNLYEVDSPQVLTGPDYLERLENPTPWTLSAVKHFRGVARSLCHVAGTWGAGQGGMVTTWRYDVPQQDAATHIDLMTTRILPNIASLGMVAGAHLLVADTKASAVDTAERKARAEENRIPRWVLIVEGWGDETPFAKLCREALSDGVLASTGVVGPPENGLYRLQATVTPADRLAN